MKHNLASVNEIFDFLQKSNLDKNKPLRKILLQSLRSSSSGILIDCQENFHDDEIKSEMEELGHINLINNGKRLLVFGTKTKNKNLIAIVIIRPSCADYADRKDQLISTTYSAPPPHGRLDFFITCGVNQKREIDGKAYHLNGVFPYFQQHWSPKWACGFAVLKMFACWIADTKNSVIKKTTKIKDVSLVTLDSMSGREKTDSFNTNNLINVLDKLGFEATRYVYNNPHVENLPKYDPEQIIYSCIESGIPCFLTFQTKTTGEHEDVGHVVIVNGHTFNSDSWWPEAERSYYSTFFHNKPPILRSTAWIDFIINDDNFGPYCVLPKEFIKVDIEMYKAVSLYNKIQAINNSELLDEEKNIKISEYSTDLNIMKENYLFLDFSHPNETREREIEPIRNKITNSRLWEIIVPIPKHIHMQADGPAADAISLATIQSTFLKQLIVKIKENANEIGEESIFWLNRLLSHIQSGLVMRSIFVSYNDIIKRRSNYGNNTARAIRSSFSAENLTKYGINKPPAYVWFTEISTPELFSQTKQRLGEIIINPFDHVDFIGEKFLKAVKYIHIPGLICALDTNKETNSPKGFITPVKNDGPASYSIRMSKTRKSI